LTDFRLIHSTGAILQDIKPFKGKTYLLQIASFGTPVPFITKKLVIGRPHGTKISLGADQWTHSFLEWTEIARRTGNAKI
jgi:hypothetical protein